MYELINGSARLVSALEGIKDDPGRMRRLANILYYCEEQLGQDIAALADFYDKGKMEVSNGAE